MAKPIGNRYLYAWQIFIKYLFFYSILFITFALANGAIAQLARVLDWQSRGRGFDSLWLHKKEIGNYLSLFFMS